MPNKDMTGPEGKGAMTGRQQGYRRMDGKDPMGRELKKDKADESKPKDDKGLCSKVVEFIIENPYPDDDKAHSFAKSAGIDPDDFEEGIYRLLSMFLTEGKSNEGGTPTKVNLAQLRIGTKVEMEEHTTSELLAAKIARDHIAEFPDYYPRLAEMEKKARAELDLKEKE